VAYDNMTIHGKKKRQEIVEAIKTYIDEHQYAPTIREIGDMVCLKSTSSVQAHIEKLLDEGLIETDGNFGSPRAIRIPGYSLKKDEDYTERELQLADFIMNNFRFCPIPVEMKCEYGFREKGCRECIVSHAHLLSKPRED